MSGKITLTLEHIDPKHPDSRAMAQTIGLLAQLIDVPTGSIKLAIVCEQEDLESYAEDITNVLSRRPIGIRVKVKKETEAEIERATMPMVTPMDKAWSN